MPQPIWTYLTALLYFTEVLTWLAIAEVLETASHDRLTRMLKGRWSGQTLLDVALRALCTVMGGELISDDTIVEKPYAALLEEAAWVWSTTQNKVVFGIPGEAGIGKTRLLQELRSGARRYGVQVNYGRCYEDLALPYLPLIEALRPLLEQGPEEMEHTLGPDAEVISRFLYRDRATSPAPTHPLLVRPTRTSCRSSSPCAALPLRWPSVARPSLSWTICTGRTVRL